MVADNLAEEYPNRKIYIVDSLPATSGFALPVHYILNMRDEGKSIDEIYEWACENNKKIIHWFVVENLDYLCPVDKIRGRKKSLIELAAKMDGQIVNPEGGTVFISHGDSPEDAEFVAVLVRERYPGLAEIMLFETGPVVGTHTGPGIITLHYPGNKR